MSDVSDVCSKSNISEHIKHIIEVPIIWEDNQTVQELLSNGDITLKIVIAK